MDDGHTVVVGEEDLHHHLQDHEHTKSTTVYRTRRHRPAYTCPVQRAGGVLTPSTTTFAVAASPSHTDTTREERAHTPVASDDAQRRLQEEKKHKPLEDETMRP